MLLPVWAMAIGVRAERLELSLADAVALALRDNRHVRSAYLQRVAQKFDLQVARERFQPRLTLNARSQVNRDQGDRSRQHGLEPRASVLSPWGTRVNLGWSHQLNQANRAEDLYNEGLDLNVVQPLLRDAGPEVGMAQVRLAELDERVHRLNLRASLTHNVTQVALAYRGLLHSQEQLRLAREAWQRSQQLLAVNRALIAAGRLAEFDIVQAEADDASQELGVEQARNQLQSSREALLQLLALAPDTVIDASDDLAVVEPDMTLANAQDLARQQRPDYLIQQIAERQVELNLLLANNQRLWDLALVGGASQVRERWQGTRAQRRWESYAGLQLEVPFGDSTARQRQVHAEVAVADQRLRSEQASAQLALEVTAALRETATHWRQLALAGRAAQLAIRKLDIEQQKLQAGRSSNFQVLSFESDRRSAEHAQLAARIAYLNGQSRLDEVLGLTLERWEISLHD